MNSKKIPILKFFEGQILPTVLFFIIIRS